MSDCVKVLPATPAVIVGSLSAIITEDRSGLTPSTIFAEPIPTANIEQSYTMPAGTRAFNLRLRENGKLSLRHLMSGDYREIPPGNTYVSQVYPDPTSITIYFKSSKDADILEIETWI